MDERVTKCAKLMADAIRDLLASANSEVEMFGLFAALQNEIGVVIERAVEEGLNVLETKLRKNDQEGKGLGSRLSAASGRSRREARARLIRETRASLFGAATFGTQRRISTFV